MYKHQDCLTIYNLVGLFWPVNNNNNTLVLSLRFEVALMHIPYTVEFINRKLTNRIDF